MQKEIETAYQTALKKKDDLAIALALSPFARKTVELVNSGAYEAAAGSCYLQIIDTNFTFFSLFVWK